jgi:toxin ParE1/3/4
MPRVLRRPRFIDDIRAVWAFIAADSEVQADRFVAELESRYRLLAEQPLLGVQRFRNYPRMRLFPFRRYLIIYQPLDAGNGIELIRLLDSARDYRTFFDD